MPTRQGKSTENNALSEACRELVERRRANGNHWTEKEDVEQDACLRALSAANADAVREPGRYLMRIVRNLFIDRQRRKLRESAVYELVRNNAEERSDCHNPERILSAKQELERVKAAIESLPPRCREAFVQHRFEHLSYSAIARRMGVSAGTVEKHIAEAMLRITHAVYQGGEDRP